jgi:NAD(P)H-flavin reductase
LPVKLTLRERDLIRDATFYDPSFANLAIADSKGIKIDLSFDDIENIQGYVAVGANHTDDLKLEKELDDLSDKLQVYLDTYYDQEH